MPKSTKYLITFIVKPEELHTFETLLKSVKINLPKVDGCNDVQVYCHPEEAPGTFTLLETWDNKSLHQAHIESLQASGEWRKIEKMLASPPNGRYLHEF